MILTIPVKSHSHKNIVSDNRLTLLKTIWYNNTIDSEMPKVSILVWTYLCMCCMVMLHVIFHTFYGIFIKKTSSSLFRHGEIKGIDKVDIEWHLFPKQMYFS